MFRLLALTVLVVSALPLPAQIGRTHSSLEYLVNSADLVARGHIVKVQNRRKDEGRNTWIDLTLTISSTLKGEAKKEVTFTTYDSDLWGKMRDVKQDQLWFLVSSKEKWEGEPESRLKAAAGHPLKPIQYWRFIRLSEEVPGQGTVGLPGVLRMNLRYLGTPKAILAATKEIVATEPIGRSPLIQIYIPWHVAVHTQREGDANGFWLPNDARLETVLRDLIQHPQRAIGKEPAHLTDLQRAWWRKGHLDTMLHIQSEAVQTLKSFPSERNILLLRSFLHHPASINEAGPDGAHHPHPTALEVLKAWQVDIGNAARLKGQDARKPRNDKELRSWLENMLWHHDFSTAEVQAATGLTLNEVEAAVKRFKIWPTNRPARAKDSPLLVLPYPGGRHPRIGFLDGAVIPQRETKISIFTPWNDSDYVVADIPEAIWSNLGLTYLAHTHVPTIWTNQKIELKKQEWRRKTDGSLEMERRLPNGIEFGTVVKPGRDAVRMEMWLKNGTAKTLSDLRVQNCVMLKGATGFSDQTNDNKVFKKPYVAVHHKDRQKWIITAWTPCDRPWGNHKCPCLHSDPKFPDCKPGETQRITGWLSFYEGKDIEAELARIEATGWRR